MQMQDLNKTSFAALMNNVNTVLLPIGMIEAHGPHASLATDMLIPREFARRLDGLFGERLLIAPEIPYGHSWGLAPFPGTIDVPSEVFASYVYEVGKGFYKNGLSNIVLFNGHGGNMPGLTTVAEKLADLGARVLTINWWADYRDAIIKIAPEIGHAGEDETSLLMAIDPCLVDIEQAANHVVKYPRNLKVKNGGAIMYPDAFSGHAAAATAEKGEAILQALLLLMRDDIEAMWRFVSEGDRDRKL